MTDKKTDTSQDDRAPSQSPVLTTPANKRVPPDSTPAKPARSRSVLAPVALVLALVAIGLSGTLWLENQKAQEVQARLATQLASTENVANRAGNQVQEAIGRLQEQETRIARLQAELNEAAGIIQDLDEALRSMTDRGSELVLLNDVDHLATIAQQQLQLGGNVRNAIVALESAQAQLARAGRPALASLLQTVNGDLDRLRAASTIDVAVFSRQLEELAMLLTEAPLIIPDESGRLAAPEPEADIQREQPAPTVPPSSPADTAWWEQALQATRDWSEGAWDALRDDLGRFIDVRRVDDANALLLSPDQAARFRENLRTRVMTAQLALMMRQPEVWKTEMNAVVSAIETRYDEASPLTRKALRLARGMADASIDTTLPTVDNTLQAINTLREEHARPLGGEAEPQATAPDDGTESEAQSSAPADAEPEAQSGGPATADGEAEAQSGSPAAADAEAGAQPTTAAPAGTEG